MARTIETVSCAPMRQAFQSDKWKVNQGRYRPDRLTSLHTHAQAGLYLVLQGAHTVISRKASHPVEPGTLIFHPPEEPHQCCFLTETKTFEMYLEPSWIEQLHPDLTILNRPTYHYADPLTLLAVRTYEEFRINDAFSSLAIEGLVLEILVELARHKIQDTSVLERRPPRWLQDARDLLHDRFAEPLTLDAIAQAVDVHPVHLGRMFRRYYQCTISKYLRELRLKYACGLLSTGTIPLVEIALSCGYSDQSNFTTAFKRHTGLTPKEYRKNFHMR